MLFCYRDLLPLFAHRRQQQSYQITYQRTFFGHFWIFWIEGAFFVVPNRMCFLFNKWYFGAPNCWLICNTSWWIFYINSMWFGISSDGFLQQAFSFVIVNCNYSGRASTTQLLITTDIVVDHSGQLLRLFPILLFLLFMVQSAV